MKNDDYQETGARSIKRYSLTMDGRRWDQLTRRAKALSTSNSALINQLVEAYLNGPTALPTSGAAGPNPMTSEAGMNMIGATYTAILDRLQLISRKVEEIRQDTALTNECLQDDGAKIDQTARDVAAMAAAFRRSKGQAPGQGQQRRPAQPSRPRPAAAPEQRAPYSTPTPTPGGLTVTREVSPNEVITAIPYSTSAPAGDYQQGPGQGMNMRERVNRLAEAQMNNGGLYLRPNLPE